MARARKKEYDEAVSALKTAMSAASQEDRDMITGYLESARNYSGANPLNSAAQRDFETAVYRNALNYLTNKETPLVGAAQGTTNMFGGRSHDEVVGDAGYVWQAYRNANKETPAQAATTTTVTSSNPTTSTRTGKGSYYLKFNTIDDWGLTAGTDFQSKLTPYVQNLMQGLRTAIDKYNSGVHISNVTSPDSMQADYDSLQRLLDNSSNISTSQIPGVLSQLGTIVRKYGASTSQAFSNYFDSVKPKQSAATINKTKLINEGWEDVDMTNYSSYIQNVAAAKNLRFMRDQDGVIKAFNADYTPYSGTVTEYNDDWRNDTDEARTQTGYGTGVFIDSNGNVYLGDVSGLKQGSTLYDNYETSRSSRNTNRNKLFQEIQWDPNYSNTDDDFILQIEENIPGSFAGADVSQLFKGNERVFVKNGGYTVVDGEIRFSPGAEFFVRNSDGKVDQKTWDDLKGLYNPNGYNESRQLGTMYDYRNDIQNIRSVIDTNIEALKGSSNQIKYVKNLLNAIATPNGQMLDSLGGATTNQQFLSNINYFSNQDEYTRLLIQLVEGTGGIGVNSIPTNLQGTYRNLKRKYFMNTQSKKDGGQIKKAEKGTILNASGQDITDYKYIDKARQKYERDLARAQADYQQAVEEGYRDAQDKQTNTTKMFKGDGKMNVADGLRLATLAFDVASIAASFVPTIGTAAAAAGGVGSTFTDLAADILDPSVSGGEVATNALSNLGFAALGVVPGAKVGKVVKNVIKWAPRIVTLAAGMGIVMDESTQNTFKKLTDEKATLNREDWRNISHVLSLVAGGVRGTKQGIRNRQVKNELISDSKTLKGLTGNDGKGIRKFTSDKIKSVNNKLAEIKAGSEGAEAKALDILKTDLGLTDAEAQAVIKSPRFRKAGKYSISEESFVDDMKLIRMWNEEADKMAEMPKFWRGVATGIGGGYTPTQRAILNMDQNIVGSPYNYYNPLIDWRRLRTKAAGQRVPVQSAATPAAPSASASGTRTGGGQTANN